MNDPSRAVTAVGAEVTGAVTDESSRDRQQLQVLLGNSYGMTRRLHVSAAVIAGHFAASARAGVRVGFSVDRSR